MLEILYYPLGNAGPVGDYLSRLAEERPKAFARLALDLEILGSEGLRSRQITIRPLGGGAWELKRLYDGVQYRLFLVSQKGRSGCCIILKRKALKRRDMTLNL